MSVMVYVYLLPCMVLRCDEGGRIEKDEPEIKGVGKGGRETQFKIYKVSVISQFLLVQMMV